MYLSNLHFSFDLWRTLIKSHPNFKKERAKHLHKNYNFSNKSLSEIEFIIRQTDLMCNGINEKTGGNLDAEEMYFMILYQINGDATVFGKVDMQQLYYEIELLIEKYTPLVYDENTISTLEQIKSKPHVTLNILSNTGFIKGKTLRKVLRKNGLAIEVNKNAFNDMQIITSCLFASRANALTIVRQDGIALIRVLKPSFLAKFAKAAGIGIILD